MFAKIITDIDDQVLKVSQSQCQLDSQLDLLNSTLDTIKIDEKLTDDINASTSKISSLRSRLTLIHSILNNASQRCTKLIKTSQLAIK